MTHEIADQLEGLVLALRPGGDVRGVIRMACRRLYASEDEFVSALRTSLVQLVPELRSSTKDSGQSIAESLGRAVLWAGLTADPPHVVEETLRNVGEEYGRQGFPPWGYHGAGHALLRAARGIQINEWTSQLSSAWVAYYAWLAAHLTAGTQQEQETATATMPLLSPAVPGLCEPPAPQTPLHQPEFQPSPTDQSLSTVPSLPATRVLPTVTTTRVPRRPRQRGSIAARPGTTATNRTPAASAAAPSSLDELLNLLRSRYFTGNEKALGAILTRVTLRTGADLRTPRPDQRMNPAVIANVIAVLQVMGYNLPSGGSETPQFMVTSTSRPAARNRRWWHRRRPSPASLS